MGPIAVLGLIGAVVLGWYAFHWVTTKDVEVVAVDGMAAPFAQFEMTRDGRVKELSADVNGVLEVPRFGVEELRVDDPRYVDTSWEGGGLPGKLSLERSMFGKSFDYLLERVADQ